MREFHDFCGCDEHMMQRLKTGLPVIRYLRHRSGVAFYCTGIEDSAHRQGAGIEFIEGCQYLTLFW